MTHLEIVLLVLSVVFLVASSLPELRLGALRIPGLVLLVVFLAVILIRVLH